MNHDSDSNSVKKVLVAMSGGVDSSVAALLLCDHGFHCGGATMLLCENDADNAEAQSAAQRLGMEFFTLDLRCTFAEKVVQYFVDTYLSGATPNPCIECNRTLKFGEFLTQARRLGYDYIATGHYAQKEFCPESGRWLLKRAPDRSKDQSYVLYSLTQDALAHTLFPIGSLTKTEIRSIAENRGVCDPKKSESQDICFIPDGDYARFIVNCAGAQPNGDILLTDGTLLGRHKGLIHYTIGQRRGIGVSYSEPLFVVEKNVADNTLILGREAELYRTSVIAENVNLIMTDSLAEPLRCTAQTRYHQKDAPCTATPLPDGRLQIDFDTPHRAPSPGQAVVLYQGEYVVGGGTVV